MLRVLTPEEVEADHQRRDFLYSSAFTVDNIAAILMDPEKGTVGMYEETACAKAHALLSWMRNIVGVEIPDKRP